MPVVRVPGVMSDVIGGTAFLLDAAGTQVVELNALGSVVWESIDGHREVADIVDQVLGAVRPNAVPAAQAEADVRAFLADLERLQLVQPQPR